MSYRAPWRKQLIARRANSAQGGIGFVAINTPLPRATAGDSSALGAFLPPDQRHGALQPQHEGTWLARPKPDPGDELVVGGSSDKPAAASRSGERCASAAAG